MHKFAITFAAAVAVAVSAGAGVAQADVMDDAYLQAIESEGIPFVSAAKAIEAGHTICNFLDTGGSLMMAAQIIYERAGDRITARQAGFLVGAAVGAYCDEYSAGITGTAPAPSAPTRIKAV